MPWVTRESIQAGTRRARRPSRARDTLPSSHGRRFRRRLLAGVLGIVGAATLLALIGLGYRGLTQWLETPETPGDPGQALLFFDRPGVPAELIVRIDDTSDVTFFDYDIVVPDTYEGESVGFVLVLSGQSVSLREYPDGSPLDTDRGCPITGVSGTASKITCRYAAPEDERVRSGSLEEPDWQLTSGQLRAPNGRALVGGVSVTTASSFASQAGSRLRFRLPAVGSLYLPGSSGREFSFILDELNPEVWVPEADSLAVAIDYRDVRIDEVIEAVAPEPINPIDLAWVDSGLGVMSPSGTILNTDTEVRNQQRLFLLGSAVGVAASMLLPLLAWVTRVARGP